MQAEMQILTWAERDDALILIKSQSVSKANWGNIVHCFCFLQNCNMTYCFAVYYLSWTLARIMTI